MRTREWRRHKLEHLLKKRIKKYRLNWYYGYTDANDSEFKNHTWSDEIGTKESNKFKKTKPESYYCAKYSPNNNSRNNRYRDRKRGANGLSLGCREKDRILFFKILKEYGFR